jgi:ATP-dependent Clp protease ATP-binding subunit ClpC
MWQRFTDRAKQVVFYAQEEARKSSAGHVSTEHLLLGIVSDPDCTAAKVLTKLGVPIDNVRAEIEKLPSGREAQPLQKFSLTPATQTVIDLAYDEARALHTKSIGTEHLLLGLIREPEGVAGRVLAHLGVNIEAARREVLIIQEQRAQPSR